MHARDDERRAQELAWFDAYRNGQGMPDLAPHEWYETAEEYDWDRARSDRARLRGTGVVAARAGRRVDRLRGPLPGPSRPAAEGREGARGDLSRHQQLGPVISSTTWRGPLRSGREPRISVRPQPVRRLRHWPPARASLEDQTMPRTNATSRLEKLSMRMTLPSANVNQESGAPLPRAPGFRVIPDPPRSPQPGHPPHQPPPWSSEEALAHLRSWRSEPLRGPCMRVPAPAPVRKRSRRGSAPARGGSQSAVQRSARTSRRQDTRPARI